ncbi:hypothetical protein [Stenotrophomonas sp.]|uniref:hypothetical protein n=1 Tax=Stenotrophomonas sp. TaxID=69392 RepID=UPI002897E985|nr:hypothetical protein [Stenotrophomonas sp.]
MPRLEISILLRGGDPAAAQDEFNQQWEMMDEWIERWKSKMAFCPDEFEGCGCCFVTWQVDAPQEAFDEIPPELITGSW